jgi:hypothetical protein
VKIFGRLIINMMFVLFLFFRFFTRLFSSDAGTYKEARPFFTPNKNLIVDYFDGNLAHASITINSHMFVFAMYYASK